jgi:DNA invertase Pin-like site-specific DNA recombinase
MAKTELVFTLSEEEETLNGEIEYRTNLFKESTIKTLVRYFKQIIAEVSANRNMRIKDISLSTGYSDSQSSIYEEAAGDFGIL